MVNKYRQVFFIDKDLDNPARGWGWVEIDLEDARRFGIKTDHPKPRTVTKRKLHYDAKKDTVEEYYDDYHIIRVPSRGKAGGKKFTLNIGGDLLNIKAQKSLTNKAVCAWIKTWAPQDTKIITPGNRAYSIDEERVSHQAHFVYFALNQDSNAIKVGRTRNLEKRMRTLQISSPARLHLIKFIQIDSYNEAEALEKSLHQQVSALKLSGEWFKFEGELFEYIHNK